MTLRPESPANVPAMEVFHDLPVLPFSALYKRPYFGDGGPVWPEFDAQTDARFNRDGSPARPCADASGQGACA